MSHPVTVIGIGDDGLDGLSVSARTLLDDATFIVGAPRHLEMLSPDDARARLQWSKDLAGDIEKLGLHRDTHKICVLATGDPLMHGIAVRLIERYGTDQVHVHPAASAFSLAAARMGWSLSDPMVSCVSVHAKPFEALNRYIHTGVRLLILSRDGDTPAQIAALLVERGFGKSTVTILERLGGTAEKRHDLIASESAPGTIDNLNTVAVDCISGADGATWSLAPGLPVDAFDHDGTITKPEVRAVTLAALAPKPGETLWDIGAGNGTVAIEWLRVEPRSHAVAIERDGVRAARITKNALALGVPELHVIQGDFPIVKDQDLPAADVVFIGGGIVGGGDVLADALNVLKTGGRLVANAVTLEAQAKLIDAQQVHGGSLVKIGIATSGSVGPHLGLKPALDVLQWRMTKI